MTAEELVELTMRTRSKGTEKIHEQAIAILKECAANGDASVVQAVFLWVKAECDKEDGFISGVGSRNLYYAALYPISYDVDILPFNLLAQIADTDIIPALQSLHDNIPPSVEYREMYNTEHDMIREYESRTRLLLEHIIQRILEKPKRERIFSSWQRDSLTWRFASDCAASRSCPACASTARRCPSCGRASPRARSDSLFRAALLPDFRTSAVSETLEVYEMRERRLE